MRVGGHESHEMLASARQRCTGILCVVEFGDIILRVDRSKVREEGSEVEEEGESSCHECLIRRGFDA